MTMIIVIVLYIRFTGGWLAFFTPGDVVVVGYGCQFAPISLSHSHKYTNELNGSHLTEQFTLKMYN